MIYQELTKSMFRDAFHHAGRGKQFSYEGLGALYDYLDEQEEYELDVIAICYEFTESTTAEALKDYNLESIDELRDNTLVLEIDDETIIYQNY